MVMTMDTTYPILEHDSERRAFIEPSKAIKPRDVPERCVITFFGEVIDRVAAEHDAKVIVENRWEDGPQAGRRGRVLIGAGHKTTVHRSHEPRNPSRFGRGLPVWWRRLDLN